MSYQREHEQRLRVGLVGAGGHAYRNILPTLNFLPVELVAVCDVDERLASATAAQYGAVAHTDMDAMLAEEQLDAVLLCVSGALHPRLAVAALSAGLHVFVEKPPALSAAGVEEMLAARGDRVCVVGFKKLFMPAGQKLRELLFGPGEGKLISLLATYPVSVPADGPAALEDPDQGGMWTADGCHPLALMVSLGGPVRTVRTLRGAHGGGACVLEFESGAIGNLHLAEGAPPSQPFERYVVYGPGFSITAENSSRVVYQRGTPFDYVGTTSFAPPGEDHGALVWEAQSSLNTLENKALFVQGVYDELAHFCAAALGGEPASQGTLEQALQVMRIVEGALVSSGEAVELEGGTGG